MHLVGLSVTQGLELVIDLSCTVSFPALPDLMSVYTGTVLYVPGLVTAL